MVSATAAATSSVDAVLVLGRYLSLQPQKCELTQELPEGLVEAVQEHLGTNYRLEDMALAYGELGVQLNVLVVGKTLVPEKLAAAIVRLEK